VDDTAVNQPAANTDSGTHPNIQEILRKRREMLNRVRADLDKIGRLQEQFWDKDEKNDKDQKAGGGAATGK
jgi:hypothetical protein